MSNKPEPDFSHVRDIMFNHCSKASRPFSPTRACIPAEICEGEGVYGIATGQTVISFSYVIAAES
jgi:hypothetical protein